MDNGRAGSPRAPADRVAWDQGVGEGNKHTAHLLARWLLDRNGVEGLRCCRTTTGSSPILDSIEVVGLAEPLVLALDRRSLDDAEWHGIRGLRDEAGTASADARDGMSLALASAAGEEDA